MSFGLAPPAQDFSLAGVGQHRFSSLHPVVHCVHAHSFFVDYLFTYWRPGFSFSLPSAISFAFYLFTYSLADRLSPLPSAISFAFYLFTYLFTHSLAALLFSLPSAISFAFYLFTYPFTSTSCLTTFTHRRIAPHMVEGAGIEPASVGVTCHCSPAELPPHKPLHPRFFGPCAFFGSFHSTFFNPASLSAVDKTHSDPNHRQRPLPLPLPLPLRFPHWWGRWGSNPRPTD